jgi:phosphatidylethanolamine-binding protein (PEBP) family uncharacterized protein
MARAAKVESQHDLKGRSVFILYVRHRKGTAWRRAEAIPFATMEDLYRHSAELISKHLDKMDDVPRKQVIFALEMQDYVAVMRVYRHLLRYDTQQSIPLDLFYSLLPTVIL